MFLRGNGEQRGEGMEIVPRSHLLGYVGYPTLFSRTDPIGKIARGLQAAKLRIRDRRIRPLLLPFRSGAPLLFHGNLFHRAPQLNPVKPRRVCKCVQLLDSPGDKLESRIDWKLSLSDEHLAVQREQKNQSAADGGEPFQAYSTIRLPENYLEDDSDLTRLNTVVQGCREKIIDRFVRDLGDAGLGPC